MKIDICVLIPVINEIENIEELIKRLTDSLLGLNYLICFIDDGSKDGTVEKIITHNNKNNNIILLQRSILKNGCQRGGALYYGLKVISKQYEVKTWVELDGDLSHQPEDIFHAVNTLQESNTDILIISKYLNDSVTTGRGFKRNFVSMINSLLFRFTFSEKITDYSNGFRLYNNYAANHILTQKIRYSTPIYLGEVLIYWIRDGFSIKEIPGKYIGRKKGSSQVKFSDFVEGITGYLYLIKTFYGK